MRYNHESYLPIGAFQPILGRMTLHGGGGGGIIGDIVDSVSDFISPVTDVFNDAVIQPISDVFAGADDLVFQPVTAPISQVTSALDDAVIQPITEPISDVGVAIDDSVNEIIPGGWGTLAQIAAAAATMGQSLAIQAAAAAAAGAGSDFAKNKDIKSAVEQGAIKGATRYGLGTLGEMMSAPTDVLSADDAYMGQAMNNLNSLQPESAVSSLVPEAAVQNTPFNAYPDAPPPVSGEIQMTDAGEFVNRNPDLQNVSELTAKRITLGPDGLPVNGDPKIYLNLPGNGGFLANDLPNDELGKLIQQQQLNQSMNSFDEIPDINGVPQRDLSANFDSSKYAPTYSLDKIKELPGGAYDLAKEYIASKSLPELALTAAGAYGLSNLVGGGGGEQQPQTQAEADAAAKKAYTYGSAGEMPSNYLLKNRVNASNVYGNATGYRPLTRYADGGEVEHFAGGGLKGLSDFATRITQPFEKAIIRPIGEAAPFLKDMAPYAGMAAGAMMGNPMMAAGVGGLASGFGKPGGFDMKRALMGGIAAYGMSNLAGGLEAAGAETALPPVDGSSTVPDYVEAMRTANTPYTAEEVEKLIKPPTISRGTGVAPRDMFSLRDTDAMQRGVGNLLQNSNTPAYKDAMSALTKNVGIYNTGVPLVMGTTGMMGVDESNALKKEYDKSMATSQAEADKYNARVAAGKKRAQQAVSENPYMFAMGGQVNPPDDQTGMPNQTPLQNFEHGGMYNYADGGPVTNAEDLDYMVQIENNRHEVDPMSDARYAGLLKQNQDYLSNIYGNIYNKPASEQPDIETVRANAQKALEMSQNVQTNIADATAAVNTAQDLIGMPTAPPPVVTTPDPVAPTPPPPPVITEPIAPTPSPRTTAPTAANPKGQYLVSNPTSSSPLSSSNIYEYQKKKRGYAEGGLPRFLSGGGDGMSDSIRANIEGSQEARLADGEFVIPADVVSHLGNGSSKAGAKQLYDMMDRVRKARTGNPKQGREIKPTKFMPV